MNVTGGEKSKVFVTLFYSSCDFLKCSKGVLWFLTYLEYAKYVYLHTEMQNFI